MFFTSKDRRQIAEAIQRAKEEAIQKAIDKVSSHRNYVDFLGSAYLDASKELQELREEVKRLDHQLTLLCDLMRIEPKKDN